MAEVEFREWTTERVMRAPSFKGLREDKPAGEVVLEVAPHGGQESAAHADAGAQTIRPRRCSTRSSAFPKARSPWSPKVGS